MPAHNRKSVRSHKSVIGKRKSSASKELPQSFVKIIRVVLIGIAGLTLFLILLGLIMSIWFWSQRQWNGENRVSVLLVEKSGNVRLYSYEKDAAVVLNLGSEVMVNTVHGYGDYKLGVLPRLGKQDGYGYELITKTVESWLGVNLLGAVMVDELPPEEATKKTWQDFINKLVFASDSTVSYGDRWYLWFKSRKMGSGDVYYLDLTRSGVYQQKQLADGSNVYEADEKKLGNLVGQKLYDSLVLARPDMPVAVVNTTGVSGLARKAAGLLSRMGYDVVSVIDQAEEFENTQIFTDVAVESEDFRYFLHPASEYFDTEVLEQNGLLDKYRSRVVVKIGKDYLGMLEEK